MTFFLVYDDMVSTLHTRFATNVTEKQQAQVGQPGAASSPKSGTLVRAIPLEPDKMGA